MLGAQSLGMRGDGGKEGDVSTGPPRLSTTPHRLGTGPPRSGNGPPRLDAGSPRLGAQSLGVRGDGGKEGDEGTGQSTLGAQSLDRARWCVQTTRYVSEPETESVRRPPNTCEGEDSSDSGTPGFAVPPHLHDMYEEAIRNLSEV